MDWVLFNFMGVGLIYFPWQEDQKHQFKNSKVTGDAGEDGYVDCHHNGVGGSEKLVLQLASFLFFKQDTLIYV